MIATLIQEEFELRVKEESLTRILKCLDMLDEEKIWFSPNDHVNSVANLVLHLSGNIRQYIQTGIGGKEDIRNRDLEFSSNETHTIKELKKKISETINEAVEIVNACSEETMKSTMEVQCFSMTGISVLIHVIEHTSYHTGQITQMTKWLVDQPTHYYEGLDLNQTS